MALVYDAREVDRKVLAILRILSGVEGPLGARLIARELEQGGINLKERAVRYHLKIMDGRGLTRLWGRSGRVITPQGHEELQNAMVADKVGLVSVRIEHLAFRTTFEPRTSRGLVPVNVSFIPQEEFFPALEAMAPVFRAGLAVSERVAVAGEGERLGEIVVPRGKIGLATICSIIVNGVLLKAGIAVETRFGGILQIKGGRPLRFLELISYAGSSLNPSEVFIQGRMTQVGGAVKGEGIILANFREVPAPCHREAEQLIQELKKAGIDGTLAMGGPNEAVCEIPVAVGRVGLVLPGGLNPVAAAAEAGIEAENQAMATIIDYSHLRSFRDLLPPS